MLKACERSSLDDHISCVSAVRPARSATGDAAGNELLLIELSQLRIEVEQLRAREEEAQNVNKFLYRVIEN